MSSRTASKVVSSLAAHQSESQTSQQPSAEFFASEAFEIRQALSKLSRSRRNTPYPKVLRKRVVAYIQLRRSQLGWKGIAKELAIPQSTITTWGEAFASKNFASKKFASKNISTQTLPAMLAVKVVDLTDAGSVCDPAKPAIASHFVNESSSSDRCYSIQSPAGYRLLGLSYAEACSLFKELP